MNQAPQPNPDPQTMTPAQQVLYYQEQAHLCATHAAHYAEQAKIHADYVGELITFHGLSSPQSSPEVQVHVQAVQAQAQNSMTAEGPRTRVEQAPPGFHHAPVVNVGAQLPADKPITFAPMHVAAAPVPSEANAPVLPSQNLTPANGTPDTDIKRVNIKRALGASMVGVLLGAAIWGGIGFVTGGWEFKYGAILIGFIVGWLTLKGARAPSKTVGVVAGVMSLLSLLLGKVLFELLVHPGFSMGEHIAYHTTIIDLIFYGATAATGFVVAGSAGSVAKLKARLGHYIPALGNRR